MSRETSTGGWFPYVSDKKFFIFASFIGFIHTLDSATFWKVCNGQKRQLGKTKPSFASWEAPQEYFILGRVENALLL